MRKERVVILFKIIRSNYTVTNTEWKLEVGRYFNVAIFTVTIYRCHANIYQASNTCIMHSTSPCLVS